VIFRGSLQTHFQPTDHTDHTEMQGFVSFREFRGQGNPWWGPRKTRNARIGNEFTAKTRKIEKEGSLIGGQIWEREPIRSQHPPLRAFASSCKLIFSGKVEWWKGRVPNRNRNRDRYRNRPNDLPLRVFAPSCKLILSGKVEWWKGRVPNRNRNRYRYRNRLR